ncbi:uncharacterized protein BDZ99DRAFT_563187 [Mytilinidion resinicola]|uniref:Zn(2)-C6 fungal-type domain-containing protein n=1 Tax=Mytilinidion resinicola TaxID=574789 RepID=A0A6A6YNZ9_9PEZI|nr:uncharacterized protein BDZ99DRAFT_563187 [Mytilinidion resinicola]KAF2810303.1 hypothetical protein BDZ99DRAFT_563187 [Mytilinidion resinicola]
MRSSNGCWTCRLRRKKCDEKHPVCDVCAALCITCHSFLDARPEWMDGGAKQEEMAEQLKREVKEKAHRRRGDRVVHISSDYVSTDEASTVDLMALPQKPPMDLATPICDLLRKTPGIHNDGMAPSPEASTESRENIAFGRSDTVLLTFYLEHLLPFLFPFYRPSLLQGGRSWVFEMMISSPVIRQATLCQSSYFFSLARGTANRDAIWDEVLTQTTNAFGVLRQALQVIDGSGVAKHLHGAVRIMASIMQMQRFEIAVLSFHNWHTHLNAALVLFRQLLDSAVESREPISRFDAVMSRLGPSSSSWSWPSQSDQVPSAEQAAFRFSSTLVILDDIIASTALQEQPRLYEYHRSLLGGIQGTEDPPINLEAVVGLKNWTLLQIGEIATLEAWKQRCKTAGNLDVVELVRRATAIKESLVAHLMRLETDPPKAPKENNSFLDIFAPPLSQCSLVSRVWAHAALIYLSIVVSGWQPTNVDVRYHVNRVIELLKLQRSPALLRTMVWPFCVAGCLAERGQEAHFRGMVEVLQPPSIFGTVHKALEIMENVWRNRDTDFATRDIATCFRAQGNLVLLV